jgi:hypothetical protein
MDKRPVSQQVSWNPDVFIGFSPEQIDLIRVGFMAALDLAYEIEIAGRQIQDTVLTLDGKNIWPTTGEAK